MMPPRRVSSSSVVVFAFVVFGKETVSSCEHFRPWEEEYRGWEGECVCSLANFRRSTVFGLSMVVSPRDSCNFLTFFFCFYQSVKRSSPWCAREPDESAVLKTTCKTCGLRENEANPIVCIFHHSTTMIMISNVHYLISLNLWACVVFKTQTI